MPKFRFTDGFDRRIEKEYVYAVRYPPRRPYGHTMYFIIFTLERGSASMYDQQHDELEFVGEPVLKTVEESEKILRDLQGD